MRTDLPPEAFTRETLQEAFNWLQNQPDAIRANILTPERLVSLYQKSQRLNDLDAPVSSKKFITDLKDLATSLDQFNSGNPSVLVSSAPVHLAPTVITPAKVAPIVFPSPAPISTKTRVTQTETTQKASFEVTTKSHESVTITEGLDSVTQDRVRQVRKRFNLDSDNDAIRVLVSLGFEKFAQFP